MAQGTFGRAEQNLRSLSVSGFSHFLGEPAEPLVLSHRLLAHETGQRRLGTSVGSYSRLGIRFHLQMPLGRKNACRSVGVVPVRRLDLACDTTGPSQRGKMRVTSTGDLAKLNCFTGPNRRRALRRSLNSIVRLILSSAAEPYSRFMPIDTKPTTNCTG